MTEDKYQGWTNRETWAVKLHWDNNEGDYNFFTQNAKDFKREGKEVFEFADFLKEEAETVYEIVFDENGGTEEAKLFVKDVGSLWRVNWIEIAEAYYREVEE